MPSILAKFTNVCYNIHEVIKMPSGEYWSNEETEWLKANYNILGCEECAERLGRTGKAVYHKASRLDCSRNGEGRPLRVFIKNGYLAVSGYNSEIFIHRAIAENKLGRPLLPDEVAHHIDGNKFNNDPDNIKVVTRSNHLKEEHIHPRDNKGKFIG